MNVAEPLAPRPLFSLPLVVALLVFATLMLAKASVMPDGDPYWHVTTGRWIVQHGAVPVRDAYSHSAPNIAWSAHEWLSEVIMYGTQHFGGWQAVQLLACAAFALTAGYMVRFTMQRMAVAPALTLSIICLAVMSLHFMARPHVFVWPLTALWVGTLTAAGEERRAPPLWLLPLMILWCNLHASFTLGLGFAGALAMDAVWAARDSAERTTLIRKWALFLVLASLCVLVNPRGVHAITFAFHVMRMKETLDIVGEWRSADFHQFQFLLLWLAYVLVIAFSGRLTLSPIRIIFVCGLLYLALKHARYHALVGLVSPFLLARPLGEGARPRTGSAQDAITPLPPAKPIGMLIGVLAAVGLAFGLYPRLQTAPGMLTTPEKALAAFLATGAQGRVFNTYGFGGYLIYKQVPVYIDGRGDMYGDAMMKEMAQANDLSAPHALEKLLAKYQIGWTLLQPRASSVELLDHLPEWERIYGDSIAVVHVRRDLMAAARAKHSGATPTPR
jgi:hypothetical protein